MEKQIQIPSQDGFIEGLYCQGANSQGAVITHPHPLYGGDMHNDVVAAVTEVYQKLGYSTLRFNFRGVGRSQGRYSEGFGEQNDVAAAVAYLTTKRVSTVTLAGYSFGAWVNACWVSNGGAVPHMVMVSPPVAFIPFKDLQPLDGLDLVVTGSQDNIAPASRIQQCLPDWNPNARFEIIKGADHFYGGCIGQLKAILTAR